MHQSCYLRITISQSEWIFHMIHKDPVDGNSNIKKIKIKIEITNSYDDIDWNEYS